MESAIESGFSCTLGVVMGGVAVLSMGFGSASRGLGNGHSVVCNVFRCFFCSCARAFVQHNKTQTNKQACFILSAFDYPPVRMALGERGVMWIYQLRNYDVFSRAAIDIGDLTWLKVYVGNFLFVLMLAVSVSVFLYGVCSSMAVQALLDCVLQMACVFISVACFFTVLKMLVCYLSL